MLSGSQNLPCYQEWIFRGRLLEKATTKAWLILYSAQRQKPNLRRYSLIVYFQMYSFVPIYCLYTYRNEIFVLDYLWEYSTWKLPKVTYRNVWEITGNNRDKMEI